MNDNERIDNLHLALSAHLDWLKESYDCKKFLNMSEHAAEIQRLSYAIAFLQSNIKEEKENEL